MINTNCLYLFMPQDLLAVQLTDDGCCASNPIDQITITHALS